MRESWTDESGTTRPCPPSGKRLNFRYPGHAALRAFVFRRDRFACIRCGYRPASVPVDYDGRYTLGEPVSATETRQELQLDHKTPRFYEGANHPENLQTLCFQCNAAKGAR